MHLGFWGLLIHYIRFWSLLLTLLLWNFDCLLCLLSLNLFRFHIVHFFWLFHLKYVSLHFRVRWLVELWSPLDELVLFLGRYAVVYTLVGHLRLDLITRSSLLAEGNVQTGFGRKIYVKRYLVRLSVAVEQAHYTILPFFVVPHLLFERRCEYLFLLYQLLPPAVPLCVQLKPVRLTN